MGVRKNHTMRHFKRKSTPKVKGGRALRKNNHRLTPNHWNTEQENVIIDVEKPEKGYKHFLKQRDILQFIELIPNWGELSKGLDAIVLISGGNDCDGYYNNNGVICISAWEREQDVLLSKPYYEAHKELFDRLDIKVTEEDGNFFCEFSVEQIKAYQLLHILLHELGHHYDRMNTKSKWTSARGENYAEQFAFEKEEQMWLDYQNSFNVVF